MTGKPTLLLVDAQEDFLARPGLTPDAATFVAAAAALLDHARKSGWNIVHVHSRVKPDLSDAMPHRRDPAAAEVVEGTAGANSPRELRPRGDEPLLIKRFFSAFDAIGLEELLRRLAPEALVVAGVHTHACIRATVDDAYRLGFHVVLPREAIASYDPALGSTMLDWMDGRSARAASLDELVGNEAPAPQWVQLDPCDQRQELQRVALTSDSAVRAIAAELARRQPALAALGASRRRDLLVEWKRHLDASRQGIRDMLVRDIAKPVSDAEGEMAYGLALLETVIGTLAEEEAGDYPTVRYRPRGLVGIITPWNNPFALAVGKIAPALGYGNAVLWKPALPATRLSLALARSLEASGFSDWVAVVPGASGTGDAIVGDPHVSAVSFTGSVPVGRQLIARAGVRADPPEIQAELGGCNAAIVDSSADLDAAAEDLAASIFSYSGQRCTAIRRLIVLSDVADGFVERLRAAIEALAIGLPADRETVLGPLIDRAVQSRLISAVDAAVRDGGTLVCGGKPPRHLPAEGCWMEPTLIEGLPADHPLNREEWFGPIAAISRARDFEEALVLHNASPFGLLGALCTEDPGHISEFRERAEAGILSIGRARPAFASSGPFLGWKASGHGIAEHGRWNRDFYTRPQALYAAT